MSQFNVGDTVWCEYDPDIMGKVLKVDAINGLYLVDWMHSTDWEEASDIYRQYHQDKKGNLVERKTT